MSGQVCGEVVIRRARSADVEAVFAIRTSVIENHLSGEQLAAIGITPQSIEEALEAQPCGWLALVDDMPAGFAMVDLDDGCLFALFVRPGHEGAGLGSSLLAMAEQALFAHHARIWLETAANPTIRANGFYRRHGWVPQPADAKGDAWFYKTRPA